jgi:hypothetical protein
LGEAIDEFLPSRQLADLFKNDGLVSHTLFAQILEKDLISPQDPSGSYHWVKEFFRTLNDSWILRKFRRSSGRKDSPQILGMIEENSRWISITRLEFPKRMNFFSRKRKERIHTTTAASMESATHRYSGYRNSSARTFGEVSGKTCCGLRAFVGMISPNHFSESIIQHLRFYPAG